MRLDPASLLALGRRRAPLALALFLALVLCSCARQMPTAPASRARSIHRLGMTGLDDADQQVMVTLASGVDPLAFGLDYGVQLVESSDWGGFSYLPGAGESPDSLASLLRQDPRVITSERNAFVQAPEALQQSVAFDDGFGSPQTFASQPATTFLDLDSAHGISTGAGVRVAILDTGAELTHPAIAGHIVGGWDFIDGDADPTDQPDGLDNNHNGLIDEALGHGTHVAGIVVRTAPAASLLIVRVLDADGQGDILGVASGIRWAIDHGARVINLSLGMLVKSDAIEQLLAEADARGIVCVSSAGNSSSDSPVEFPASSDHVLAVAATDASGVAAGFTSYGDFVALSAPGVAIRSAYIGGRYVLWSGTSMSAPFVSGAAALLLAVHPAWGRIQVMGRLATSSRPIDGLNPSLAGELGAGELAVGAALQPDAPPPVPLAPPLVLLRQW